MPAVALTATVTEQTKYTSTSPGMVDTEIIAASPNGRTFFHKCSTSPHTGDNKSKVLLLPYTAKLQVMRKMMPHAVIYILLLWTLYIDKMIGTFDLNTVSLGWGTS